MLKADKEDHMVLNMTYVSYGKKKCQTKATWLSKVSDPALGPVGFSVIRDNLCWPFFRFVSPLFLVFLSIPHSLSAPSLLSFPSSSTLSSSCFGSLNSSKPTCLLLLSCRSESCLAWPDSRPLDVLVLPRQDLFSTTGIWDISITVATITVLPSPLSFLPSPPSLVQPVSIDLILSTGWGAFGDQKGCRVALWRSVDDIFTNFSFPEFPNHCTPICNTMFLSYQWVYYVQQFEMLNQVCHVAIASCLEMDDHSIPKFRHRKLSVFNLK